jgi:hypothetical protein
MYWLGFYWLIGTMVNFGSIAVPLSVVFFAIIGLGNGVRLGLFAAPGRNGSESLVAAPGIARRYLCDAGLPLSTRVPMVSWLFTVSSNTIYPGR